MQNYRNNSEKSPNIFISSTMMDSIKQIQFNLVMDSPELANETLNQMVYYRGLQDDKLFNPVTGGFNINAPNYFIQKIRAIYYLILVCVFEDPLQTTQIISLMESKDNMKESTDMFSSQILVTKYGSIDAVDNIRSGFTLLKMILYKSEKITKSRKKYFAQFIQLLAYSPKGSSSVNRISRTINKFPIIDEILIDCLMEIIGQETVDDNMNIETSLRSKLGLNCEFFMFRQFTIEDIKIMVLEDGFRVVENSTFAQKLAEQLDHITLKMRPENSSIDRLINRLLDVSRVDQFKEDIFIKMDQSYILELQQFDKELSILSEQYPQKAAQIYSSIKKTVYPYQHKYSSINSNKNSIILSESEYSEQINKAKQNNGPTLGQISMRKVNENKQKVLLKANVSNLSTNAEESPKNITNTEPTANINQNTTTKEQINSDNKDSKNENNGYKFRTIHKSNKIAILDPRSTNAGNNGNTIKSGYKIQQLTTPPKWRPYNMNQKEQGTVNSCTYIPTITATNFNNKKSETPIINQNSYKFRLEDQKKNDEKLVINEAKSVNKQNPHLILNRKGSQTMSENLAFPISKNISHNIINIPKNDSSYANTYNYQKYNNIPRININQPYTQTTGIHEAQSALLNRQKTQLTRQYRQRPTTPTTPQEKKQEKNSIPASPMSAKYTYKDYSWGKVLNTDSNWENKFLSVDNNFINNNSNNRNSNHNEKSNNLDENKRQINDQRTDSDGNNRDQWKLKGFKGIREHIVNPHNTTSTLSYADYVSNSSNNADNNSNKYSYNINNYNQDKQKRNN